MAVSDVLQRQLFSLSGKTAAGMGTRGTQDLDTVGRFYRNILMGDRSATAAQAAPETNAALDAADAARRSAARFETARTGGGADVAAGSADATRKNVDDILASIRASAAPGLMNVSQEDLTAMANALGPGLSAATSDINSRRAAHAAMWSSLIGGAGSLVGGGLAGGLFRGKSSPPPTDVGPQQNEASPYTWPNYTWPGQSRESAPIDWNKIALGG
jgi:hypothetical protein